MIRTKKQIPAGSMILLIIVLLNAIILETAYTGDGIWYWALLVSGPLLLIAIRDERQKKGYKKTIITQSKIERHEKKEQWACAS